MLSNAQSLPGTSPSSTVLAAEPPAASAQHVMQRHVPHAALVAYTPYDAKILLKAGQKHPHCEENSVQHL
jgi:hypothetical protein